MKQWLAIFFLAVSTLTGCAASHFQQVKGETLILYLDKPKSKSVYFYSSLDGFAPVKAEKSDGLWVVSLSCQKPFSYFYVLDGEVFTPPCRLKEKDDFGSENCLFDPRGF